MKIQPAKIKWIVIGGFGILAGICMFAFQRRSTPDPIKAMAGQYEAEQDEFKLASVANADENKTKLSAIADETSQQVLGNRNGLPPAPVATKPILSKGCEGKTAWERDENCPSRVSLTTPLPPPMDMSIAPPGPPSEQTLAGLPPPPTESTVPATAMPMGIPMTAHSELEIKLMAMAGSKADIVTGRAVKASQDMLKKGSMYLAIIQDAILVRSGEEQNVVIEVLGRLSVNTTVKPFKLYGKMKLNPSGTRIWVEVTDCIAEEPNASAIPCKGSIRSFTGETGLEGDLYNPRIYGNLIRAAGTVFGGVLIGQKSISSGYRGAIYDQSFSNNVIDAVSGAAISTSEEIAKTIEEPGKSIQIAAGAYVKVLIEQDASLW